MSNGQCKIWLGQRQDEIVLGRARGIRRGASLGQCGILSVSGFLIIQTFTV